LCKLIVSTRYGSACFVLESCVGCVLLRAPALPLPLLLLLLLADVDANRPRGPAASVRRYLSRELSALAGHWLFCNCQVLRDSLYPPPPPAFSCPPSLAYALSCRIRSSRATKAVRARNLTAACRECRRACLPLRVAMKRGGGSAPQLEGLKCGVIVGRQRKKTCWV
jgi:hypothetical protein